MRVRKPEGVHLSRIFTFYFLYFVSLLFAGYDQGIYIAATFLCGTQMADNNRNYMQYV
jgi:hypothetical protein